MTDFLDIISEIDKTRSNLVSILGEDIDAESCRSMVATIVRALDEMKELSVALHMAARATMLSDLPVVP